MSENTGNANKQTVYTLFNDFLKNFIKGKSLFSDTEVFTEDNLLALEKAFIENAIDKDSDYVKKRKKENENVNFDVKVNEQLKNVKDNVKELFANLVWLRNLPIGNTGMKRDTKVEDVKKYFDKNSVGEDFSSDDFSSDYFVDYGIASYGMLNLQKFDDIASLILLFIYIFSNNKDKMNDTYDKQSFNNDLCDFINDSINNNESKIDFIKNLSDTSKQLFPTIYKKPIINMLLNISDEKFFEPIASYPHKLNIVKAFSSLLSVEDVNEERSDSDTIVVGKLKIDQEIGVIKEQIKKNLHNNEKIEWDESFYSEPIISFWNFKGNDSEAEFSEFDALKYKRQIVFYGPPGTSKTYSAKKLAEMLIRQSYIQTEDINTVLMMDFKEEFEQRILNLQLHQNYSYEDFIVGMKIVNNETKWEKGYLLKLIDKINEENQNNEKDKKYPYILILDEINRVDLSRLFGELFSAIENRDETVKLSAIDESNKEFLGLKVPENLYFIGTMNQIDFSLERIDFALRRRFVWYFYGYNENRLREIIYSKCYDPKSEIKIEINSEHIDELIRRASAINESLEKDEDFGKEWEIGHTFFADIVDILKSVKTNKTNHVLYVKSNDTLTNAKEPVKVLWHISIKPMLEAYCGNLDKNTKLTKMKKFESLFLSGK